MSDDMLVFKQVLEDLNAKIINIGLRIDRLEKISEKVEVSIEKLPYTVGDAVDKNLSSYEPDSFKEDLNELKLTMNDIQRQTTFVVEALTREKMKGR